MTYRKFANIFTLSKAGEKQHVTLSFDAQGITHRFLEACLLLFCIFHSQFYISGASCEECKAAQICVFQWHIKGDVRS